MGRLEPDDVGSVAPSAGDASEVPPAESRTGDSVAMATRPAPVPRRGGRPTRGRLAAIAVIGVVAVLAVAFALSWLGGGGTTASPTPSLDATQALCLHLRDLQTPREDSLGRLADTLQSDADTIGAQGDAALAAEVLTLRTAVLAYRAALVNHSDLTMVSVKMGRALRAMPC
jgi:hypothetical protein